MENRPSNHLTITNFKSKRLRQLIQITKLIILLKFLSEKQVFVGIEIG